MSMPLTSFLKKNLCYEFFFLLLLPLQEPDTTQTCWDSFKYHISKWAARLPLINFLYFAFFDDATGYEFTTKR